MSIREAARAAIAHFPWVNVPTHAGTYSLPVVMVAIAGAESGYDNRARGDVGIEPQFGTCDGYTSWGLWQIHNSHRDSLIRLTGSQDPCAWAEWLYDPDHNARMARAIYDAQGFDAWATTWYNQRYVRFLPAARAAIDALVSGSPAPTLLLTPTLFGLLAAAAIAASGLIILVRRPAIGGRT